MANDRGNSMDLGLFIFTIIIAPVYLNDEVQETVHHETDQNLNCTNNKVLSQTLNILRENLIQEENQAISPDKFKQVLDSTIDYLNNAEDVNEANGNNDEELKNILDTLNRPKKEVLRNSLQGRPETLTGKISIQYELPITKNPDCQTMFKGIVNALNTAYLQMNRYCKESGKCQIQGEHVASNNLPQKENLPSSNRLSNQSNIIDFLGSYPQNGDVMTLLQNYRPNVAHLIQGNVYGNSENVNAGNPQNANYLSYIQNYQPDVPSQGLQNTITDNPDTLAILQSFRPNVQNLIKDHILPISQQGFEGNGFIYNTQILQKNKPIDNKIKNNVGNSVLVNLNGESSWNDLTRHQGPLMEYLQVLNKPTGYVTTPEASKSLINANNDKLYIGNITYPAIIGTGGLGYNLGFHNLGSTLKVNNSLMDLSQIPEDMNNLRFNGNVQNFPSNVYTGSKNIQTQSDVNFPKYIKTQLSYNGLPNYQGHGLNNFVQPPTLNVHNEKLFPNDAVNVQSQNTLIPQQQSALPNPPFYFNPTLNPSQSEPTQILPNQQKYYKWYQNQQMLPQQLQDSKLTIPDYNNANAYNQESILNSYLQTIKGTPISDNRFTNLNIFNNSNGTNHLYRLNGMTNGPKWNMAPNKNGVVELTFTLQRPQSFVYKPLYYVKYRLPYKTYLYNVQKLLQKSPFLRNNPAQLYQELLAVANVSESSQDLKDLGKEEISKLVTTSGALVKAKVVDGSEDTNSAMEEDVKNILHLTSNFKADEILNATKNVIDNIETVVNDNLDELSNETEVNNATQVPVKTVNARSLRYPIYPRIRGQYMSPTNRFNGYNMGMKYLNRPVMLPPRVLG